MTKADVVVAAMRGERECSRCEEMTQIGYEDTICFDCQCDLYESMVTTYFNSDEAYKGWGDYDDGDI